VTQAPARRICPYCQSILAEGARLLACSACGTAHHADCWAQNGGCAAVRCGKHDLAPIPITDLATAALVPAAPPAQPAALSAEAAKLVEEIALRVQQGLVPQAQDRLARLRSLAGELHPAVHEAEGDLAAAGRRHKDAEAHYHAAFEADPRNARVEEKYATALVRTHMPEYLAHLPPDEDDEAAWWVRNIVPRPPWAAALLSAFVPGVGQWFNGDFAKGAALVVVFTVAMSYQLWPIIISLRTVVSRDQGLAAIQAQLNWLILVPLIGLWVYAIVDAGLVARAARGRL
jgi:hypothetical protein